MKLKVFGERNCGTNYLIELLKLNFDDFVYQWDGVDHPIFYKFETLKDLQFYVTSWYNLGWKHKAISKDIFSSKYLNRNDLRVLIIIKNPYSFLLSLYKRPYHYSGKLPESFSEFIRAPWKLRARDNLKEPVLDTPIELWNKKVASYLDVKDAFMEKVFIVKYEDLVQDPEQELIKVSSHLGLNMHSEFINYFNSTKNDQQTYDEYKSYYVHKEWKSKLSDMDVDFINSKIDTSLLNGLGYLML